VGTKTRRSRRTLALPVRYIDAMRTQRAQQAAERLAAEKPGRTASSYSPQGMEPRWTRPTSAASSGERTRTERKWRVCLLRHPPTSPAFPCDQMGGIVSPELLYPLKRFPLTRESSAGWTPSSPRSRRALGCTQDGEDDDRRAVRHMSTCGRQGGRCAQPPRLAAPRLAAALKARSASGGSHRSPSRSS
jgi:hypothetical protein